MADTLTIERIVSGVRMRVLREGWGRSDPRALLGPRALRHAVRGRGRGRGAPPRPRTIARVHTVAVARSGGGGGGMRGARCHRRLPCACGAPPRVLSRIHLRR